MRATRFSILLFFLVIFSFLHAQEVRFDKEKDLLLAQFDCKTDVDDLHTVAALASLLSLEQFTTINYHAVAGTYGIQKGLYVPANELFQSAFGTNWSDAHTDKEKALQEVLEKVKHSLDSGGAIWVADAGQSDFSAQWVQRLAALKPDLDLKKRVHLVQHSNWNQDVTNPKLLAYVKNQVDYRKIPDGNSVGNGSPGFNSSQPIAWKNYLKNAPNLQKVWQKALDIGNRYNGVDGRYLNKSIATGALDFSDLSETCYILGLESLKDANAFFAMLD